MAVDLPPQQMPQAASPMDLRALAQGAEERIVAFHDYLIHVAGEHALDPARIAEAVRDAATLSDALLAIQAVHYIAGYPAVQLRYTLVGHDLYVLVLPGRIESLTGRSGLHAYFRDLTDGDVLTAARLEPRRALAGFLAERNRQDVRIDLEPGTAPGSYALRLTESAGAGTPLRARVEVGNPGNRYVGRDFADGELSLVGGGGELRVLRRENIGGDGRYREHAAAVSIVATPGLFGLDGRNIDYVQTAAGARFVGHSSNVGLSWSFIPYADFGTRWLLGLRIEDAEDRITDASVNTILLEEYSSLEVSSLRTQALATAPWPVELQLGLVARTGLGGGADADYRSYRPTLRLRTTREPPAQWTLVLDAAGQWSDDTLPQQQQYVLGGRESLAAWVPGVVVADRGYQLRLRSEWSFGIDRFTLTPRLFTEIGGGSGRAAGDAGTLADVGAELALGAGHWLEASVTVAIPVLEADVDRDPVDAARSDCFFRISLRY